MYHMRNKKRASWFQTVFTKLSTHWKKCLSQETLSNTLYLRVCFKTVLKFYCADYLVILICTFWSSTSGVGPEILPFSQAAGGCLCSWSTEHTVGNKAFRELLLLFGKWGHIQNFLWGLFFLGLPFHGCTRIGLCTWWKMPKWSMHLAGICMYTSHRRLSF